MSKNLEDEAILYSYNIKSIKLKKKRETKEKPLNSFPFSFPSFSKNLSSFKRGKKIEKNREKKEDSASKNPYESPLSDDGAGGMYPHRNCAARVQKRRVKIQQEARDG